MGADVLVFHDIIKSDPESRKLDWGAGGGSKYNQELNCCNSNMYQVVCAASFLVENVMKLHKETYFSQF